MTTDELISSSLTFDQKFSGILLIYKAKNISIDDTDLIKSIIEKPFFRPYLDLLASIVNKSLLVRSIVNSINNLSLSNYTASSFKKFVPLLDENQIADILNALAVKLKETQMDSDENNDHQHLLRLLICLATKVDQDKANTLALQLLEALLAFKNDLKRS
jgi:hypothetical protein